MHLCCDIMENLGKIPNNSLQNLGKMPNNLLVQSLLLISKLPVILMIVLIKKEDILVWAIANLFQFATRRQLTSRKSLWLNFWKIKDLVNISKCIHNEEYVYAKLLVPRKTFFLSYVLDVPLLSLNFLQNSKLLLLIKDLLIKRQAVFRDVLGTPIFEMVLLLTDTLVACW